MKYPRIFVELGKTKPKMIRILEPLHIHFTRASPARAGRFCATAALWLDH